MKILSFTMFVVIAAAFVTVPSQCQTATTDEAALQVAIDTARTDLKADKKTIVTETMQLSDAEAKKFWPVYERYQRELDKLNDERISILKQYVDNFWQMSETDATVLTKRVFDWQQRRNDLRKKSFDDFAGATSGLTAAKFFQVEHRLDLVLDLQIAAGLPGLFMKASAATPANPTKN